MRIWLKIRRFTVRTLGLLVLVSALVLTSAARAQGPPAQLPKMTYTKNTVFRLPVQMEERTRANLREVCLYVKSGSGDWVRQETGLPNMTDFSYKVPRDGEYWFSLVTVDKLGQMTPRDVSQEPPGLRVMVDTQPPMIDVQTFMSPENEFCLRCQVQDANPDPQSLKATYRDQTGEHVLDAVPGSPGVFKIVGRDQLNQPLHITAADLCGNVGSRDVNVGEMVAAAMQMNKNATKVLPVSGTEPAPPAPGVTPETVKTDVQKPSFPPLPPVPERIANNTLLPPAVAQGSTAPGPNAPGATGQGSNLTLPPPSSLPPSTPLPAIPQVAMPGKESLPKAGAGGFAKQMLNTTHATIDYRIDQVGPSGVGKVEIYLTSDGGLIWQRHGEDPDRRSPAEIDLPGEGLFGIRLVVTNGSGFGGTPPARGDAPTCWIEVDTTPPVVQLRPVEPAQYGFIELRWTASDKNFSSEPISLFYKTRTDGPWQPIARNIKNDGLHRWSFPRDQGSQFFVKIEATDLAGNVAHAETPNAIILDVTEPHASVVGVTGTTQRLTPPSGN